jgi:hypothetical protein
LCVVDLACAEQGVERVVAGNDEAGNVDEEGAADVEEDQEEVDANKAENGVDLGDRRLPLQVVEGGVLGQLERIVSTNLHLRAHDPTPASSQTS